jgi:transcriptional regulator with XRE-family HTH domain
MIFFAFFGIIYPMDRNQKIGARISEARKRLGLSQQKLAVKLDLSYQQIQKYEQGRSNFKLPRLKQLADALGMKVEDLIGIKEEPAPNLDKDEAELLKLYRKVKSPAKKKKLVAMVTRISRLVLRRAYSPDA